MKGLLRKDYLVIMKQLKLCLLLIPVMALLGGSSVGAIAILMGAILPATSLAYDEQSKWNALAAMMPYRKRDLVLSKYLLGYVGLAGAALLFAVVQLILPLAGPEPLEERIFQLSYAVLSGLLFLALDLPILFRYGTQKGRIVYILFIGFAVAGGTIIQNISPEMHLSVISPLPWLLVMVLLNVGSIFLSLRMKDRAAA